MKSREAIASDQNTKPRQTKSREVSSRYLSPSSAPSNDPVFQSPHHNLSPRTQKPRSSVDSRIHQNSKQSGFLRGLWPSSSDQQIPPPTLADHLGNDRLKDLVSSKPKNLGKNEDSMFLNRQKSCTEFSRFEIQKQSAKENHKPLFFSGSMRYTGKFKIPGRSPGLAGNDLIVPGRLSVDENAIRRKSIGQRSEVLSETLESESSEFGDMLSGVSFGSPISGKSCQATYAAPTMSSRFSGKEVPSKYMQDSHSRSRRWSSDSISRPQPSENSPRMMTNKVQLKRENSLSSTSKWSLSPGRPTMSPSSGMKPPTSPSRGKGVGSLLSMGLELLKGKKSSSSPLGPAVSESVHQLRLMHNRLVQWRYANARADAVTAFKATQAQSNLLYAWTGLVKLQQSVLLKRLQLEKERLQMKLYFILHSQIKPLEAWGDLERQHLSAVSVTKDHLHSIVCRIPLTDGAKVELKSAFKYLRYASDLAASIKLKLFTFSPMTENASSILSELADVVSQEKALLEECLELFRIISTLEIQERSLKCNVIQLRLRQQQPENQENSI